MKRDPDFVAISRLLRGYGITGAALACALGCAPQTARKKLNEPQYFTLGELSRISRRFGIPMESLREAVRK